MTIIARHATRNVLRFTAIALLAATATISLSSATAQGVARQSAERPLYKDPSQPVDRRVEDLLQRMTLEEKVGQMVAIWEHKDKIQTPRGDFSPQEASRNFPNGLGQISRPSDRRGVKAEDAPGGAAAPHGRRRNMSTLPSAGRWKKPGSAFLC
jgi:beta-glucosidase